MKVAVLGLGRMGEAIAHRLVDGGHELTVWNRSDKGRALADKGATVATSPKEAVAASEVVITSLANDDAVREVALGDGWIRGSIGERPYVDCSTVSVPLGAELAGAFDRYVAMPILGAPQAVRSGTAIYLAGGPAELVEGLRPITDSLTDNLKRYDRPEKALAAKVAVNVLLLSGIVTLAESVTVARAGGMTDEQITDLLGDSPMLAPGMKNRFRGVLDGSGEAWWSPALAAKDAGLAMAVAESGSHTLRLVPVVHALYDEVARDGAEDDDIVAVARLYR